MKKAIPYDKALSIFTTNEDKLKEALSGEHLKLFNELVNASDEISATSGVLDEVKNGMGYADARAKSNRIFFNAWLNGQTSGYSYGELVDIANDAIWQYRNMYLRPDFYANNLEKVRVIIAPVIEDYKSGKSLILKQNLMLV